MEDEWIEWHGGECPLRPDTKCQVRLRNGTVTSAEARVKAGSFRWLWGGQWDSHYDIVAYRSLDFAERLEAFNRRQHEARRQA